MAEEVFYDSKDSKGKGSNHVLENKPEISINALPGIPCPNTMRLWGNIGTSMVAILVDSRSTHNFLNPSIVSKKQLTYGWVWTTQGQGGKQGDPAK